MPKGFRDIKTSTGAKAKRFLPPTINISVGGRRIGTIHKDNQHQGVGDWDGSVEGHLHRNSEKHSPAIITSWAWAQTFKRKIKLLEAEIAECEEFDREGIAGSKDLQKLLEDRRVLFQEMFETF